MRTNLSRLENQAVAQAFLPVWVLILLTAALLPSVSCKQKRKWATPEPLTQQSFLGSSINISDPASSTQLLSGLYGAEDTWRWTKKDFSVALGRQGMGTEKGSKVTFVCVIPDPVIQQYDCI